MDNKQRLELTWIGKENKSKLEPRILIYDKEKSYGDQNTENILIHGDNLLALKSIESDYINEIQCIYIDPPFNTGNAFDHYDDLVEHSIWLNLMRARLEIMKNLLKDTGVIVVHLDDKEMAYCKIVMDEIFGRINYINTITMTTNEPSGFKATGAKIFSTSNYLLIYAKNKSMAKIKKVYKEKEYDSAYSKIFTNLNGSYKEWQWCNYGDFIAKLEGYKDGREARKFLTKEVFELKLKKESINYADRLFRTATIGGGAKIKRKDTIELSKNKRDEIFVHPNEDVEEFYILNGEQILFYKKRLVEIDGRLTPGEILTDVWNDISWTGIANEGKVQFKNGKKPELLIKRILELFTDENDVILDSFGGSGTTGAVAHKMKRKWIMVEMGEQCYTHCLKRITNIIDNNDDTGISKLVNWNGGGGFKFYELAPSLLKKDKYGNWVIDKDEYNVDMLASAVAKLNGYKYCPDEDVFWKQGISHENSYIFTTTQYITAKYLDMLSKEIRDEENLLICCSAFDIGLNDRYDNIIIKKIPQSVLDKCDFGINDYNMNVVDLNEFEREDEYYE